MWPFAKTDRTRNVFLAWDADEGQIRTIFWKRNGVLAVVRDRGVYEYVPPRRLHVREAIAQAWAFSEVVEVRPSDDLLDIAAMILERVKGETGHSTSE